MEIYKIYSIRSTIRDYTKKKYNLRYAKFICKILLVESNIQVMKQEIA